jgi:hypothetical protein
MADVLGQPRFIHGVVLATLLSAVSSCGQASDTPQPPAAKQPSALPRPTTATGQSPASDRDQALSREVEAFLETWLIRNDARGAVQGRASEAFADERFVPAELFSREEYERRFPAARMNVEARMAPQEFQNRLGDYVESLTDPDNPAPQVAARRMAGLAGLLLPFSPEQARDVQPEVYSEIVDDSPRAMQVAGVASLAYPVRDWDDISWSSINTVGFRSALGQKRRESSVDVQAVLCRLRPDSTDEPEALVLTLWSDEGTNGTTWRMLGLVLPPVK